MYQHASHNDSLTVALQAQPKVFTYAMLMRDAAAIQITLKLHALQEDGAWH